MNKNKIITFVDQTGKVQTTYKGFHLNEEFFDKNLGKKFFRLGIIERIYEGKTKKVHKWPKDAPYKMWIIESTLGS